MKTFGVFIVSLSLLFVTLRLCAQTANPTNPATPATPATPAAPAAPATDEAATGAVDTADGEDMDAQDVARKLLNTRRRKAVLPSADNESPKDNTKVAPPEIVKPIPDPPGSMIVNRLGRLRRNTVGDGWTFHFESDNQILYEPPLGVLPNRMLEAMENILEKAGESPTLFKITGELTSYRGQRFVLIRRMIVKRDTGAM